MGFFDSRVSSRFEHAVCAKFNKTVVAYRPNANYSRLLHYEDNRAVSCSPANPVGYSRLLWNTPITFNSAFQVRRLPSRAQSSGWDVYVGMLPFTPGRVQFKCNTHFYCYALTFRSDR